MQRRPGAARRRPGAGAERVLLAVGRRHVRPVPVDARLSGARRRHAVGAGPAARARRARRAHRPQPRPHPARAGRA
ncbi:hypothetical protein ACFSTC_36715 [Nonomuraea ferruginea]